MLRNRLLFGVMMGLGLVAVVLVDGWLDGSLTTSGLEDSSNKGVLFLALVCLLMVPANMEFAALAAVKGVKVPTAMVTVGCVAICTTAYWPPVGHIEWGMYLCLAVVGAVMLVLAYQGVWRGPDGAVATVGASALALVYLGVQGAFVVGIRLGWGVWILLMYIWVVKGADIGAFAVGHLFGRHKLLPAISPGKTWEGLIGAAVAGVIVSLAFTRVLAIMNISSAIWFGLCFAVLGQAGDLVESVLKRDAKIKDASNLVPGFGGILDLVDSPLTSAPWAYLYLTAAGLGN